MVEATKKPVVRKAAASKSTTAEKKTPAKAAAAKETAVWPFPEVEKTVAAKPAKKAAVAEETVAKKPAARKAAAPKAKAAAKVVQPSAQERYRMVETAAYYIAERSGFQGCTTEHWAAAEREIAEKLGC